jgi:two-component system response regulator FlrC
MIATMLAEGADQPDLVFDDPVMQRLLALARQVAPADASVLITGESGTGKEVLARYVHRHSRRSGQRFVSVNCAAIPESLLESELFGHEKGAFTGAAARRIGRFEEADRGTLLLDEVSEMDPRLQAKLLRAIQEREVDRLGGARPVKVDIRLIATSNRDLEAEVAAGRFREDLWFRLNVVNLHLPPLRERPADIVPLARHFADRYAASNGLPPGRSAAPRSFACASTIGAATCASWRTACTARSWSRAAMRSARATWSCRPAPSIRRADTGRWSGARSPRSSAT